MNERTEANDPEAMARLNTQVAEAQARLDAAKAAWAAKDAKYAERYATAESETAEARAGVRQKVRSIAPWRFRSQKCLGACGFKPCARMFVLACLCAGLPACVRAFTRCSSPSTALATPVRSHRCHNREGAWDRFGASRA
jgi:hypothetical protein